MADGMKGIDGRWCGGEVDWGTFVRPPTGKSTSWKLSPGVMLRKYDWSLAGSTPRSNTGQAGLEEEEGGGDDRGGRGDGVAATRRA